MDRGAPVKRLRAALTELRRGDGGDERPGTTRPFDVEGGATPAESLWNRYRALLPEGKDRVVVILADHRVPDEVMHGLLEAFRGDRTRVLARQAQPGWKVTGFGATFRKAAVLDQLHHQLSLLGPVDLLINLRSAKGRWHRDAWTRLFFHLCRGGAYVVPRPAITTGSGFLPTLRRTAAQVGSWLPDDTADLSGLERELRLGVSRVLFAEDYIIVGKRTDHLLKVRDDVTTTRLLRRREPGLRVTPLATLAPGTLEAQGELHSYNRGGSAPLRGFRQRLDYPMVSLRRYEGHLAVTRGAVLHTGDSVLPDSFRFHWVDNPINPRLLNAGPEFARFREEHVPRTRLEGTYYYLDYSNTGHFGHFMTEALAKLWGWDVAKKEDPELKILLRTRTVDPIKPGVPFEQRLLTAYGIAEQDQVWIDEPVWAESIVGATPMWQNHAPHYVHPGLRDVWSRLRAGLVKEPGAGHRRIFVTRRIGNRRCHNYLEVEEFFAAHGFEIVQPELLDLSAQATIFAEAEVVAGFAGSNLFSLLYTQRLSTLIVLSQEAYDARNEHLFASALGADTHYFWSAPDQSHPQGRWSYDAYRSEWQFDMTANTPELERLLASL
ncbi:glycosyltransferase family 61 protein [Nocardioides insulae]|uniref:glycosyltransferase family 61 protein n=1 Tax=Nocardioides insulae TaxID=394734 RepID=UPI000405F5DB|nr:glycosyltransferase 61 family protein [Nocardioides insulae]